MSWFMVKKKKEERLSQEKREWGWHLPALHKYQSIRNARCDLTCGSAGRGFRSEGIAIDDVETGVP